MIHSCFVWFSVTQRTYDHDLRTGHYVVQRQLFFVYSSNCQLMHIVTVYVRHSRKNICPVVKIWYLFYPVVNCHVFCIKFCTGVTTAQHLGANSPFSIKPQFFPLFHHLPGPFPLHAVREQCPEVAHRQPDDTYAPAEQSEHVILRILDLLCSIIITS